MKMILAAFLFMSLSSFARTPDQCATPGEVLNREFTGLSGDPVKASYYRLGSAEIPTSGVLNGSLKTKTYKNFKVSTCEMKVENYQEQQCQDITLDLALGHGNQIFKGFYDLNTTLLKRGQSFAATIVYSMDKTPAERLDVANQVVLQLTRYASTAGIPKTWNEFTATLTKAVEEGFVTQVVFDDIIKLNQAKNAKALGLAPLEGAQFKEAEGNGKLQKLFDLTVSGQVRATLIQTTLDGLTEKTALALSKSFIDFATANGVPDSWAEFVVMMKASVTTGAITQDDFTTVVIALEESNRHNLGFELTAFLCKMIDRTRNVNVISVKTANDFFEEVSKTFKITLINAPLLQGEKETYDVNFDGVNKIGLDYSNAFNDYAIIERSEDNGVVMMKVQGTRKQVAPSNTIVAKLIRSENFLNLELQNTNFNALAGGKVMVKVEFLESIVLWPDRKLATQVYELSTGDLTALSPKVAMKNSSHKHLVKVSMQITGSKYYSEGFTQILEYKE
jgi:hypothetical protein